MKKQNPNHHIGSDEYDLKIYPYDFQSDIREARKNARNWLKQFHNSNDVTFNYDIHLSNIVSSYLDDERSHNIWDNDIEDFLSDKMCDETLEIIQNAAKLRELFTRRVDFELLKIYDSNLK